MRPSVDEGKGRRGRRPLQGGCDAVRSAVDSRRAGMEPRTYDKKTPPQMWRRFSVTYWIAICLFSGTSSGRFGSVRVFLFIQYCLVFFLVAVLMERYLPCC